MIINNILGNRFEGKERCGYVSFSTMQEEKGRVELILYYSVPCRT